MEELTNMSTYLSVGELIEEILTRSGYWDELKQDASLEAESRRENLQELKSMAQEFEMPTGPDAEGLSQLDAFLATAALMSEADQVGEGQDKVVLMTLHSAKGLEFPVVFLVGMEEGVFPHSRALTDETEMEEERRLCYVGMTRAQRRLYLTSAMVRTVWGQSNYNTPSRFLEEIPPELLENLSSRPAWGAVRRPVFAADDDASPPIGAAGWGQTAEARRLQRRSTATGPAWSAATEPAWSTPAGPAPAADAPPVQFEAGDRVRHPKFGEGVVREVRGDVVTVHFPGAGLRVLVAGYLQKAGT
jgi:DNA helicase-2/ATP-dependent DNA helicase PcrA